MLKLSEASLASHLLDHSKPFPAQVRAHPTDIMAEVFRALRELGIAWKKAAHYNVKCRWAAPYVEHPAHGGGSGDSQMLLGTSPPRPDGQPPTAPDGLEAVAEARLIKFEIQVRIRTSDCLKCHRRCE